MFEIDLYLKAVLTAFYEKRDQGELVHLQRASRGDLMKEFVRRLESGQLDSELPDLMRIFDCAGDKDTLKKEVKKADSGKFRPLQDFIQEKTNKPTDNVVKLLAIFIDFEPRPFEKWIEIKRAENEKIKVEEVKSDDQNDDTLSGEDVTNVTDYGGQKHTDLEKDSNQENNQPSAGPSKENETITIEGERKDGQDSQSEKSNTLTDETSVVEDIVKKGEPVKVGLLGGEDIAEPVAKRPADGSIRSFYKDNKHIIRFSTAASIIAAIFFTLYSLTPEDCMCWNGKEYVAVDCQDKMQRHQVIGLDKDKLAFFRKITQPDTLGLKDVGHVWYSKIDNEVEFFTGAGKHPVHNGRSLKAATRYMLETRAGKNAELPMKDTSNSTDASLE